MTVKELRAKTGLSQAKFAERYGLGRRNVERWESQTASNPPSYLMGLLTRAVLEDTDIPDISDIYSKDSLHELGYLYGWICAILSHGKSNFCEWQVMPLIPFTDGMTKLIKLGQMPTELDERIGLYLSNVDMDEWDAHLRAAVPIELQGSLLIGFSKGRQKAEGAKAWQKSN